MIMDLDTLLVTETWLIATIFGEVTPAEYSFHHAARIHKKDWGVVVLLRGSLKCETHSRFQAKVF